MTQDRRVAYDFAVLRVVPHVHLGAFVNIGVILHAPTQQQLELRLLRDHALLRGCVRDVDLDLLERYFDACEAVCRGDPAAGPVALLPPSERFHWLTAPRSDVLQPSPVHAGVAADVDATVERLFRTEVLEPAHRMCAPPSREEIRHG